FNVCGSLPSPSRGQSLLRALGRDRRRFGASGSVSCQMTKEEVRVYRYRWVAVLVVLGALAAAATSAAQSRTASAAAQCNTSVTSDNFGTANSGPYGGDQTVWRYTLTNSHCMQVRVITYGATVQSIEAPDRNGHLTNVALGFNTLADYVN